MSDDEYDDLVDDIANLQDVDWSTLLEQPFDNPVQAPNTNDTIDIIPNVSPLRRNSSTQSSSFNLSDDDNLDESFFAELNAVEQRLQFPSPVDFMRDTGVDYNAPLDALTPPPQINTMFARPPTTYTNGLIPPTTPPQRQGQLKDFKDSLAAEQCLKIGCKRSRSESFGTPCSPKKGKMKANIDQRFDSVLSEFEEDLTCPICFEILVCAHVGNPCGHSLCGDCGWQWVSRNETKILCPVCRTRLIKAKPMIPNVAMDNVVHTHIKALARSGDFDWNPEGVKYKEWLDRKKTWKRNTAMRQTDVRPHRYPRTVVHTYIADLSNIAGGIADENRHGEERWDDHPQPIPRSNNRRGRGRRRFNERG